MNILFTTDKNYLHHVIEVVRSLEKYDNVHHEIYIITSDVNSLDLAIYQQYIKYSHFNIINIDDEMLKEAPTSKRYPYSIYYRLFAGSLLPQNLNRVLYLDPDVVILKNLEKFYFMDFEGKMFVGATHLSPSLLVANQIKNGVDELHLYINTGVILMNLDAMRKEINAKDIYDCILKKEMVMTLPDQDIINILYGTRIKLVDAFVYNIADRDLAKYNFLHPNDKRDVLWVKENSSIIHYYGRNKPWKKHYHGVLNVFYEGIPKL